MTGFAGGLRLWGLAAGFALFAPLGAVSHQAMAPAFLLPAAAILLAAGLSRPAALRPARGPLLAFLALAGWAAFTHVFAVDCAACAERAPGKLATLGLVAWAAASGAAALDGAAERRSAARALVGGLAAAIALMAVELAADAPVHRLATGLGPDDPVSPSRYNRAASALVILSWPAAAWLWGEGRRGAAAALVLAAAGVAFAGESLSAQVASILAVAAAGAAAVAPGAVLWTGVAAAAGFSALAPWVFLALPDWIRPVAHLLPGSAMHRVEIWHFSAGAVFEAPVLGHGFGAIRDFVPAPETLARYARLEEWTSHPHNAPIQLWLDLGAVGLALAAALAWFAVRPARGLPPPWRAAALAAAAATAFTAMVSFGAWQETWLGMVGMALLAFRALAPGPGAR